MSANNGIGSNNLHISEKTKTQKTSITEDGPHNLNYSDTKNGSSHHHHHSRHGKSSRGSFLHRISKNTIFRIFLLLLILALLIPILVLAALIYKQMGMYRAARDDSEASPRMIGGSKSMPDKSNTVAGEPPAVPNAQNKDEYNKQMEEIYKNEPWRRDPTSAWKNLGTVLTESVDPRGDACGDFYGYSCDQWKDRNPLDGKPEISNQIGAYEVVKVRNNFLQKKSILKKCIFQKI